jgi:hypothetical protein
MDAHWYCVEVAVSCEETGDETFIGLMMTSSPPVRTDPSSDWRSGDDSVLLLSSLPYRSQSHLYTQHFTRKRC